MIARDELALENIVFANSSAARRFEFENLEPSYVNCANWVGFVVEDSHSSDRVLAFDLELLFELALGSSGDRGRTDIGNRRHPSLQG